MTSYRQRLEHNLAEDPTLSAVGRLFGDVPCWVAGGWVRDRAIGRTPLDLDLVVEGNAESAADPARRLAQAHGAHAHLLGRPPRAVWRVQSPTLRAEIWPLDGLTPQDDAARRDFTCNSLLWRLPHGPLVDCCGGLTDIRARSIRAVSRENLTADPVRLLRGPRFVATLPGFSLDSRTTSWIAGLAHLLSQAPGERIGAELFSMAQAPRRGEGFMVAHTLGLLGHAGPRQDYEPETDALGRLTGRLPHPVGGALRVAGGEALLAWLARAWGVETAAQLSRYAWTRPIVHRVLRAATLSTAAAHLAASRPADRRETIFRAGDAFPAVLALAAATNPGTGAQVSRWRRWWRQWLTSGPSILATRVPLRTEEVAAVTGLPPGPALGRALEGLHSAVVRREVRSASGARRWLRAYSA